MILTSLLTVAALSFSDVDLPERKPLAVQRDTKVKAGEYVRPPLGDDGKQGVILLEMAKNVTLDLTGVELRGTPKGTDLDKNAGWGIVLRDCENVTIKGGTIGGYKGCLVAFRCKNLVIDGVAFDGWYGQRLLSTAAAEDGSDWLFPHENDQDEWLANHGAAIALTDCEKATIRGSRGRHGQNGILLVRSNDCALYDDDFSFMSGWGLAMYRSSRNVVSRCLFDYGVRGYSHDVYWRGQDSAGILMFERCCDNLFAHNSATHGGDGVFLYAGQDLVQGRAIGAGARGGKGAPIVERVKDGQDAGGSDRNVWYRNDFSYAVANAIEATFSRDNWAIENLLSGSHQHGVWGGYSSRMVILDNEIDGTLGGAISIEHGQECAIAGNSIRGNETGLELWWDEDPDLVGGPFGKHRDTSSRDHLVLTNAFAGNARDVVLTKTKQVILGGNVWGEPKAPLEGADFRLDPLIGENGARASGRIRETSIEGWSGKDPEWLARARAWKCPDVPGSQVVLASERGEKQGLDTIVMGEWGPWDFRSGEPRPKQRAPGGLLAGCAWEAAWFSWKGGPDPREDERGWRKLAEKPLERGSVEAWTNPWGGSTDVRAKVGNERFGLVATTTLESKEGGKHRLTVVSDDGVRVKVDGKTVLEDWTWHAPKRDQVEIDLAKGARRFEIEYFQIDGATALTIELERVAK